MSTPRFIRALFDASIPTMKISKTPTIEPLEGCDLLIDILPAYLQHCESHREVSPRTLDNYRYQLGIFFEWLSDTSGEHGYRLLPQQFQDFNMYMKHSWRTQYGQLASDNTRATILKRLRDFFTWLHKSGHVEGDISSWIPRITETPRAKRPIAIPHDIVDLFVATDFCHRKKQVMSRAVLALLFGTGARREEIAAIERQNIKIGGDGYGYIYLKVAKGNKPRAVVIGPGTSIFLRMYLDEIGHGKGRIFTNSNPSFIYKLVKRLCANCPPSVDTDPHSIRAMWSIYFQENTALKDERYADRFLRCQLGYASTSVLERNYLTLRAGIRKDVYCSPMEEKDVLELAELYLRQHGEEEEI